MTNDYFACIFVPDFSVEARLRVEPDLRTQAVVVLEGTVPLQRVFAVNEKARQAGVEPEMSKIQIEACSGLTLRARDRKSTRLNSSHVEISYAVFCLKKKK